MQLPPIQRLQELFTYDPQTGWLLRKAGRKDHVGKRAGSASGPKGPLGHRRVRVDGVRYFEHKVIWAMVYGQWPALIDHINRDATDNRIANLRELDAAGNTRNRTVSAGKTSSLPLGVTHSGSKQNPYRAQIIVNGRRMNLGAYPSTVAAEAAYLAAKAIHHPEYTPLN